MKRKLITSNSKFESYIGFSRAVRVDNFIFVSGTAPILKNGETAGIDNLFLQTRRCFQIMKQAVEEAGGSLENVIRTRIYLKDASQWKEAARAHAEIFLNIRPACTFVEVKGFINPEWMVETEMDCYVE